MTLKRCVRFFPTDINYSPVFCFFFFSIVYNFNTYCILYRTKKKKFLDEKKTLLYVIHCQLKASTCTFQFKTTTKT